MESLRSLRNWILPKSRLEPWLLSSVYIYMYMCVCVVEREMGGRGGYEYVVCSEMDGVDHGSTHTRMHTQSNSDPNNQITRITYRQFHRLVPSLSVRHP